MEPVIYTVGHSTRPVEEFIAILKTHHVALLCDVRTIPRSRHNPQYEEAALAASLKEAGIEYRWFKELGGLRHAHKNSPNGGWRNASFRGYADYMQTPAFAAALEGLETLAREQATAIMCAEAVPWRCHRSLIADALVARGWRVLDIFDEKHTKEHKLNPMARVEGGLLTYPPAQEKLL